MPAIDHTLPYTAAETTFDALIAVLDDAHERGLHLYRGADDVASQIWQSRWLHAVKAMPTTPIDAPAAELVDGDSRYNGTSAPFEPWEHDHTGLVHVLWGLYHSGASLADDCSVVAATLIGSRWFAALRAHAIEVATGV